MFDITRFKYGLVLAIVMAIFGYFRKSLSMSGAIGALVVGTAVFTGSIVDGVLLVVFFLSSSAITKIGKTRKRALEGEHFREGGRRTMVQVLCNSLPAVLIALAKMQLPESNYREGIPAWKDVSHVSFYSLVLLVGPLAHFACCCGDTWSSELGILAETKPFLITNPFRQVPPGTNGGVTLEGLLFAVCGGFLMGLSALIASCIEIAEHHYHFTNLFRDRLYILAFGAAAGLIGSVTDSVLGALMQVSFVNSRGVVCDHTQIVSGNKKTDEKYERVAGMCKVLDNHAVNLVSASILTCSAPAALQYVAEMMA